MTQHGRSTFAASDKPTRGVSIAEALHRNHVKLDETFRALAEASQSGSRDALRAVWTTFERALEAHLQVEEHELLPLFERVRPEEAERVRIDHARLRAMVATLGVDADLGLVRADMIDSLLAELRAHGVREEAGLYGWADREPHVWARAALRRIRTALRH